MRRAIRTHRSGPVVAALAGLAVAACAPQTRWERPMADANTAAADQSDCERSSSLAARQQVMFDRLSGPRPVRNGVIGYPTGGGFYERVEVVEPGG